jgi:hypothetical protein
VYSNLLPPGVSVDFLVSYLIGMFVASTGFIAAVAAALAVERHRYPPSDA